MRARALVSIVAGTAVLVGGLAVPTSAESENAEQVPPLPAELPAEVPAELPAELPADLPLDPNQLAGLLNATGLLPIVECITGGEGLAPDVEPAPEAVLGVLLCIAEATVTLLSQTVADLLATATEAAPAG